MISSRIIQALTLTVIGIAITACAGATPTPAGPQQTVTWKLAGALPESDPQMQTILRWAKDVEQRTQKTSTVVKFEYFLASQLYAANQIPQAIAEGAVETGLPYATVIGDTMIRAMDILQAPLVWDDEEHWRRTVDGDLGQLLAAELEKQNMKVIWFNQFGSYEAWGREKPIIKPDDGKGLRARSLGGIYNDFYAAIGAATVNVPSAEQYSAFQRGIVDWMVQDYGTIQSRKLYEVLKYGTKGGKLQAGGNPVPINLNVWNSLPKDTQDAILAAGKASAAGEVARLSKDYDELSKEIASKGVQLTQMTDADRKAWFAQRKTVEDAYVKSAGDLGRKALELVEKYRKG